MLADSHANYIRTVLSLATTVQMPHLDDIAEAQGPAATDITTVNDWLQDPPVARQFKALGYRYDHIGGAWRPDPHRLAARTSTCTVPATPGTGDFADALYDASACPPLAQAPAHARRRRTAARQYTYSDVRARRRRQSCATSPGRSS